MLKPEEVDMKRFAVLIAISLATVMGLFIGAAEGRPTSTNVDCDDNRKNNIQEAVDRANGPFTIFIEGNCEQDVILTKDDITLSGFDGESCNKAKPTSEVRTTWNV